MSARRPCQCSPIQIQKYLSKISGPLLDRIDIHLQVPALKTHELLGPLQTEGSSDIKRRCAASRRIQQKRFESSSIHTNAQMTSAHIKEFCSLDEDSKGLLKKAIDALGLSARAHDKILKVARTISDLAGSKNILPQHIAEAISYRALDRAR